MGTLLGRRRQSTQQTGRPPSPEKRPSNLGSLGSFSLRGSRSKDLPPPVESAETPPPARRRSSSRPQTMVIDTMSHPSEQFLSSRQARRSSLDRPNGTAIESIDQPAFSSGVNGSNRLAATPQLQAPQQPGVPAAIEEVSRIIPTGAISDTNLLCQPQKDAEGFSVPPSAPDAISQAEQEVATYDLSSPRLYP